VESPEAGAYFRLLSDMDAPRHFTDTSAVFQFPIPRPVGGSGAVERPTLMVVLPLRQALCISLKATNLLGLPPVARLLL
jgi:hypothetical protein